MLSPRIALLSFALLLCACSQPTPERWHQVSGEIALPADAALPHGAQLTVWLEEQGSGEATQRADAQDTSTDNGAADNRQAPSPLAELRQQAQPPLTFLLQNLQLDPASHARYRVRARVETRAGKLLWHSPAAQPLTADNTHLRLTLVAPAQPAVTTAFFKCDGEGLRVTLHGDEATLSLGENTYLLTRIPSGSGTHYQSEAADFWSKGDEAILTLVGEEQRHCTAEPRVHPWSEAA